MSRALAAAVALCLVACGEDSRLKPDDQVTVSGNTHRQDGSALASRRAILVKEPDVGEVLIGFTAIVGTIGVACLAEEPPEICEGARTATTTAQGGFSFSLLGEDTQGTIGQASTFNLAVSAPPRAGAVSGASRTEKFTIQSTQIETPDLRLWEPQLSAVTNDENASVTFGALPSGATAATVAFQVGGKWLWGQDYQNGQLIDARLLEDADGTVSVSTRTEVTVGTTEFESLFESESVEFLGRAGAPPSRHAVCTATGASGEAAALESCTVTDGDFFTGFFPPADPGCVPDAQGQGCATARANRVLTVDLGSPRAATLLVVRGITEDEIVETSPEGLSWSAVTLDGIRATFNVSPSVRFVRVRGKTDNATLPTTLSEISVW